MNMINYKLASNAMVYKYEMKVLNISQITCEKNIIQNLLNVNVTYHLKLIKIKNKSHVQIRTTKKYLFVDFQHSHLPYIF